MKAIIKLTFFCLLALNVTTGNAGNSSTKTTTPEVAIGKTKSLTQQEADALVKRVFEIRSINANLLTKAEKRQLKNELFNIKQQLSGPGGVYISGGALLLIIILLIIFL